MMQITYEIPSKISDMNKTYLKEADTFLHTPVATHVRFKFHALYLRMCVLQSFSDKAFKICKSSLVV